MRPQRRPTGRQSTPAHSQATRSNASIIAFESQDHKTSSKNPKSARSWNKFICSQQVHYTLFGATLTGKVHLPSKLLIFANFCSSLWAMIKSAISWIFHIFIESPVRFCARRTLLVRLTLTMQIFFVTMFLFMHAAHSSSRVRHQCTFHVLQAELRLT